MGVIHSTFRQLKDAATIVAAVVVLGFVSVIAHVLVQLPHIIDEGKSIEFKLRANQFHEMAHREYPLGVELDALWTDGCGQIQCASRFQDAMKIAQSEQVPIVIHRVTIASESEVLDGVKTGERIGALKQIIGEFRHEIRLLERYPGNVVGEWTDIDDIDLSERGDMGHESINASTDIKMTAWPVLVDSSRDQQILVKVMTAGRPASRATFTETGRRLAKGKGMGCSRDLALDAS